jgi:FAS-associated factor 2
MLTQLSSGQITSLLVATFQRFQLTVMEQEQRRIEREQADELRRQQDAEYHESLRADQERERRQREELEREQRLQQEREEQEREQIQAETDRLDNARALLRPEPENGTTGTSDGGETITPTRIRFQLPTGQKLERRFWSDETIASLKAYLILHFAEQYEAELSKAGTNQLPPHHHMIKNVALSENFPKKKHDDDNLTLRESGLVPQAVLMVQDLDA